MSVFEIAMLVCFGAAWPVSIYKSLKTRAVAGKSLFFLVIVLVGYVAGILHKLIFHYDLVIFLYAAERPHGEPRHRAVPPQQAVPRAKSLRSLEERGEAPR